MIKMYYSANFINLNTQFDFSVFALLSSMFEEIFVNEIFMCDVSVMLVNLHKID